MWPFSTLIREPREARASSNWFPAFLNTATKVHAGVTVDQSTAACLPAVYKCWSLNAETIGSLPLDVFARRGNRREPYSEPAWIRSPNQYQTMSEFIGMTQVSLDADGNAFWLKAVDDAGRLAGLSVIAPTAVEVRFEDVSGQKILVYWVTLETSREPFTQRSIVHLRGLTMPGELRALSPIDCAKQTIGIGIAAEEFGANFFGTGATMSGLVNVPGNLTDEQAKSLAAQLQRKHGGVTNSHAIGVLSGGATWTQLSVKPEEAQFLESRRYTATEIANLYGVPPELVTDVEGAKGYVTALSARLRLWYITGLMPRLARIEDALSSLMPSGVYVKFNRNALLQMDPAERTKFYQAAQLGQWMTRNEIRALEDMNPVPGGDEMLTSVQWQQNQPPPGDGDNQPGTEPASAGSPVKETDQ